MTTIVTSFFTDAGIPKTGLTPTITIRETSTGTVVVNGVACTSVGGGFYRYVFTYEANKDYSIIVDGGSSLFDTDRYKYTSVPADVKIVQGNIA